MITSFILTVGASFLAGLFGLLPQGHISSSITSAFYYFWYVLNSFSYIFPVSTLLAALLVVVGFDAIMVLWHFIQWIIRKIPGMQ